jgi:DNA-binding NarL/FixJ family response regulator
VLSARTDEDEKEYLFQRGADDYVTKPFGMSELLARSEAALRRYFKSWCARSGTRSSVSRTRPTILLNESGVGYRLQTATGWTPPSSGGRQKPGAPKRRTSDREKSR